MVGGTSPGGSHNLLRLVSVSSALALVSNLGRCFLVASTLGCRDCRCRWVMLGWMGAGGFWYDYPRQVGADSPVCMISVGILMNFSGNIVPIRNSHRLSG